MGKLTVEQINDLTFKYVIRVITDEEKAILDEWLDEVPGRRKKWEERVKLKSIIQDQILMEEGQQLAKQLQMPGAEQEAAHLGDRYRSRKIWKWLAGAAAAILIFAIGYNYQASRLVQTSITPSSAVPVDLPPGGNRAVLILADGRRITLDSARAGAIANQAGSQVIQSDSGMLTYQPETTGAALGNTYNTVITPAGGQYKVVLPDGTVVWMNAASTIRFPTTFKGKTRDVEMSGEVYFEVAANASHPFVVRSGDVKVQVLGTHFNLMAYPEEKSRQATLLEGAIIVSTQKGQETKLRPGQQAIITTNILVQQADTSQVIAWKDGFFIFNGEDIETVMRTIGRWYDVNIEVSGPESFRSSQITARLSRKKSAGDLIEVLRASGFKVKLEAPKTLKVYP
ncbi:FecR domain-containing protein [Chitinophaga sp. CC14]|uniref:FecR family protein n=1 Tax=Chitinophaga sp. CC14 TaxID=3029199 RepID=UPI003B813779